VFIAIPLFEQRMRIENSPLATPARFSADYCNFLVQPNVVRPFTPSTTTGIMVAIFKDLANAKH
jgi:hypothetical protein